MNKFLKYFIILIAIGLVALWYFRSAPEVEVIVAQPATEAADIPGASVKAIEADDDIDDISPVDTTGKTGFVLDFEGKKLGTRIGRAKVTFAQDSKSYEITTNVRTAGIVKTFFNDRIIWKSIGELQNGKMATNYFLNSSIKPDKKDRDKIHTKGAKGVWAYTSRGTAKDLDAKIYDSAVDPLTVLIHIGHVLTATGKCDFSHNAFMDETGFVVQSNDKGNVKDSGIKLGDKKITERRCDIVVRNRAGKVIKDFPFDHEFAKKKAKVRASKIHVHYAKMGGDVFVPVFIRVYDTPAGDIDIKLTKVSRF